MSSDEMISLWRGLNATLGFGAFFMVLFIGVKPKFRTAGEEMQLMMITTLTLIFVVTWSSIEQALQGGAFGLRVPLTTVALVIAWAAMLRGHSK